MMEENVVSSAGTSFRLDAGKIERLISAAGYEPRRRNNWYELLIEAMLAHSAFLRFSP